ncbi:MAG TPA: ABC transporter permease [Thermoanaerobaculia bacterium]|nr:ABC transporter permease [Thermoanaerobaculia bacterium]
MKPVDEEYFGHAHTTVIEPPKGWRLPDFRELWAYRELAAALGARDIRVRYKQTVMGAAWAILQPLATMILFTLIFGRFARIPSEGYPYAVFVYAGLLPWTLFSSTITAAANSLVGSSGLITKIWFPRLLIPAASVASPLVDFAVSSLILLVLMLGYGVDWSVRILLVPLLVVLLVLLAVSIGIFLSAFIVRYRDVRFVIPFLVQFWMFASPVIYPPSIIPEAYRWILWLNPMTGVIEAFRWAFLGKPFDAGSLAVSVVAAVVALIVSISWFERVEEGFADVI